MKRLCEGAKFTNNAATLLFQTINNQNIYHFEEEVTLIETFESLKPEPIRRRVTKKIISLRTCFDIRISAIGEVNVMIVFG